MKRNTIKWRIFKYNLAAIVLLTALTTIIFNVAVRVYFKSDTFTQLSKIATRAVDTALKNGPDFFPKADDTQQPAPRDGQKSDFKSQDSSTASAQSNQDMIRYYFMLDRSLREPLSVLSADYILLDSSKNVIIPSPKEYFNVSNELIAKVKDEIEKSKNLNIETSLDFTLSGTQYIAIVKPVSEKNNFGLGWVAIYSSLQKVNQLQLGLNLLLLAILILSSVLIVIFSSLTAKKISEPFTSLNEHIGKIAERKFGNKLNLPEVDELHEFVNNINIMSDKLEVYDKAQKTFLQNASHEFRTPLMSIRSYAEGIKYDVVDKDTAADVIVDETKRMTRLVEDLLYLSRLDSIEENYRFDHLDFNDMVKSLIERMNILAIKNSIRITVELPKKTFEIYADEEKLSRAFANIVSNCIRYAKSSINIIVKNIDSTISLEISDDGPGFDSNELSNIFDRFYKGKKGNFGLGLAISRNVIERHGGNISAENTGTGALFKISFSEK